MEINSAPRKEFKNQRSKNNKENFPFGITTGSAATAASLAALLSVKNNEVHQVNIKAPFGVLEISVEYAEKKDSNFGRACITKMPYNDPDVTKNLQICADVKLTEDKEVKIKGGKGIGTVTKPGLQVPVGEHAINPVPRQMIIENLKEFLPEDKGAEVTVFVPDGEKIAKKTMNERLGIIGGISILGTTGIARPMSSKAYRESLVCQIDVAIAEGYNELIFVPGNIGERLALEILDVPKDQIIQMGNFVGFMLNKAQEKGVRKITLFGHAGKLIKIAAGISNTKNSVADARHEIIAAYSSLFGAGKELIQQIFESKTTEDMINLLDKEGLTTDVFDEIARTIKDRCEKKYGINFDVIIVKMDGTILNNTN